MTNEEKIASEAWSRICKYLDIEILEFQNLIERIAFDAYKAGAEAQREADAQIAEAFIPSGFTGNFGIARDDRARTIAHCIRTGQKPNANDN